MAEARMGRLLRIEPQETPMRFPQAGGMPFNDFLNAVLDDGIEEVKVAYAGPGREERRLGAIAGFELFRGQPREALKGIYEEARKDAEVALANRQADYWFWRLRHAQAEWVLNVVNAADHAHRNPVDFPPTARGLAKAVDVLGVAPAIQN